MRPIHVSLWKAPWEEFREALEKPADCIVTDPPPWARIGDFTKWARRYYLVGGSQFLRKPPDQMVPGGKVVDPYYELIVALNPLPEVVLDPYMGTGTTGIAAARAGVSFVGVEISADRFDYAEARMKEALKHLDITWDIHDT